jgi:Ser/Thr protein kinase RdoA (MazF antagonist)
MNRDVAAWTLTPWLPGDADYWKEPRPAKLDAALRTLAEIHLAAAAYPVGDKAGRPRTDRSPALVKRADRLEGLKSAEWAELNYHLAKAPRTAEREVACEALELIRGALGRLWDESLRWCDEPLPLQWVIRDVWHDHVLFTADQVTGVIDFGAAAVDSPAGDVARLLGSLVGDDEAGWRRGIAAYQRQRSLSSVELDAVRYFDASGTLLSAFNWVHWLFRDPSALGKEIDRAAARRRLERLVGRLRQLAG